MPLKMDFFLKLWSNEKNQARKNRWGGKGRKDFKIGGIKS
jgi:hypothetical protein